MIHIRQRRLRSAAISVCTILAISACASGAATPADDADATAAASPSVAAADSAAPIASATAATGPRPIEGGDLSAGTVYVNQALGLSVQPPDDGWYALVPNDEVFELTRDRIAVWFAQPTSIRPDGTAASTEPAPSDPADFAAALEGHPAVTVTGTEPFAAGGLEGLLVDIESSGMSAGSAAMLTSDGDPFGFPDGEGRLILLTTDAGLVIVSIEGGESRMAAWEIAEPLVRSVAAAP